MRKKLGDLLLKEGVITNAQLEEALKCQVIFGGKLGTNLIEMGAASEQDVCAGAEPDIRSAGGRVRRNCCRSPPRRWRLCPGNWRRSTGWCRCA